MGKGDFGAAKKCLSPAMRTTQIVGIGFHLDTPLQTNMEPENGGPMEEEIPFGKHHFQVPAVSFRGPSNHTIVF